MEEIILTKITILDLDKLQTIGKEIFEEAFSKNNSRENMEIYLKKSFSKEKLSHELLDENSEFYFAKLNNEAIGYLKVNFGISQTELQDNKALEIERIYVFKEFYGKNIGQKLFEKAIAIAQQKNLEYVWLGVWEKNDRALSFYQKNGFQEFDKHTFFLGNEKQTDIMMKKILIK